MVYLGPYKTKQDETKQGIALRQPDKTRKAPSGFLWVIWHDVFFFKINVSNVVVISVLNIYVIYSVNLCVYVHNVAHIQIEFRILLLVNLISNLNTLINFSNKKTSRKGYCTVIASPTTYTRTQKSVKISSLVEEISMEWVLQVG